MSAVDFISVIWVYTVAMNPANDLTELHRRIKNCKRCDLSKSRKNAVPGEGPISAQLMFVGEAPGAKEDEIGRPFVGRSGILLTELLTEAGIERNEVFITSVLKSRPPNNRRPTSEEVKACLPYLMKQIEIISPKIIVLLGSVAVHSLIGPWKLREAHGKLHMSSDGLQFFVTYHPAACLRYPKYRETMLKDLKQLKSKLS